MVHIQDENMQSPHRNRNVFNSCLYETTSVQDVSKVLYSMQCGLILTFCWNQKAIWQCDYCRGNGKRTKFLLKCVATERRWRRRVIHEKWWCVCVYSVFAYGFSWGSWSISECVCAEVGQCFWRGLQYREIQLCAPQNQKYFCQGQPFFVATTVRAAPYMYAIMWEQAFIAFKSSKHFFVAQACGKFQIVQC